MGDQKTQEIPWDFIKEWKMDQNRKQLALAALSGETINRPTRRNRRPAAPKAPEAQREIVIAITPRDLKHNIDRMGRPYAWTRCDVVFRKKTMDRTVMIQNEAYHVMQHLLGIGASLKIRAVNETVVNRETGDKGGKFYRALSVLKVFDAEGREIDGTTGLPLRMVAGHERSGHYRRQHYGPNNSLVKIVWIDDVKVNGGLKAA
jgi:hypothetical protein